MSAAASVVGRGGGISLHRTIPSVRAMRRALEPSLSVGFVPTMGALHEGHLSLIREARRSNDVVIASIFVNPTQFGAGEDLDKYPRQLEQDKELLTDLEVDHLFAPDCDSMYGPNHVTYVEPEGFDDIAEGVSRPGHFKGVATVVTKLFNIVKPTNAYFGQKDAAQCCLIRRIVHDLDMDVNVVIMDTVREPDGLAMSSRNAYLTEAERKVAPIVYQSLCTARDSYHGNGGRPIAAQHLQEVVESILRSEPLVTQVQYVSVDCRETMRPLQNVGKEGAIISLACKIGSVRLIDNMVLKPI
jgi:pantoate--beta-alanine ligase